MACLRVARAHGYLHSASDAWRVLVSDTRMQQGLVHQHSQVRAECRLGVREGHSVYGQVKGQCRWPGEGQYRWSGEW